MPQSLQDTAVDGADESKRRPGQGEILVCDICSALGFGDYSWSQVRCCRDFVFLASPALMEHFWQVVSGS